MITNSIWTVQMVKYNLFNHLYRPYRVRSRRKFSEKIHYQRCSLLTYPKTGCELGPWSPSQVLRRSVIAPLTRTSASYSMLPRSEAATHVYVAVSRTSVSCSTFLPIGILLSGVSSRAPSRHFTCGMGDPTATQVRLTAPPDATSVLSGRIEKCGGTRRTATHTDHIAHKQWRKPGPKFGGTKKILPSPQIQKLGGTARNSLFLLSWNYIQLNIE